MKDLKEALKEKKVVMGTKSTLRLLKIGKLKKVYTASNCPENIKDDVSHYAKISNIEVVDLKENNEELGTLCKKSFFISVLGI